MTDQETLELDGYRKAYALLQKGMGSQAELMDGLKQQVRDQAAELERLRRDLDTALGILSEHDISLPGTLVLPLKKDAIIMRLTAERDAARAAGLTNKETT